MQDMKNQISNLEYENQNLQMTVSQLEMQNSQFGISGPNFEQIIGKPIMTVLKSLDTSRYDYFQP